MIIEKAILAIVTIKPDKVAGGAPVFICETKEEMDNYAKNIEAILDGIAHAVDEDVYMVVKHF
ncbi:hypothetical protein LC087_06355 [Bacillus carboniphilus]|uniref:Uncharacterized protein n=1 Tax=Bacillus carboniphilus TaxID=86663 RepID=A0ABY9JYA9_9BACI|nr:hypothetical protein [Bacillus carboniphilus]WLR43748.1 hypothetical protein LC087_06355 [Bacillus carboniphilus]